MARDFSSPYYPYDKVIPGALTLRGAEEIPHRLLTYLLDLPDALGYAPSDDNDRPRVRLMKYLCNDGETPLSGPLPSPQVKRSILFDPRNPDINDDESKQKHPLGYRLFMQRVIGQSTLDAKTFLKCYMGRTNEPRKFFGNLLVTFEIWSNVNLVTNTRTTAYDRTFDMEQCLWEALNGVNIAGVGTVSFARPDNAYNGGDNVYNEGTLTGRVVRCSIDWAESGSEETSGMCGMC